MTQAEQPYDRHRRLLEDARQAQAAMPAGYKIEISGDEIIMMAAPTIIHQRNLLVVRRQFDAHCPDDLIPSENTDLSSPETAKLRNPDLTYLSLDAEHGFGTETPAHYAALVVEVVSPTNPENDWHGKVRDYPSMGIPTYLIVDPRDKQVTLLSGLASGRYHLRTTVDFGTPLPIPAPFGFTLMTEALIPYA
ncbi:Uma2 family endonuclease [Kitasatospora sp. NPDC096147]|uniref:Uma2 family endonuclease n=1 Tax=Kitasatospora sp. NPDC096147 TaxID=3364093 RepID=UPI00380056CA